MTAPDTALAELELSRARFVWRDRLSPYAVRIDGKRVGTIRNGQTAQFFLAPGSHKIRLTYGPAW